MVFLWFRSILRHVVFRGPKKGPLILTTTHILLLTALAIVWMYTRAKAPSMKPTSPAPCDPYVIPAMRSSNHGPCEDALLRVVSWQARYASFLSRFKPIIEYNLQRCAWGLVLHVASQGNTMLVGGGWWVVCTSVGCFAGGLTVWLMHFRCMDIWNEWVIS